VYETIGRSLGTDYFGIADQLTREELGYLRRTRTFVDTEVLPVVNDYWERAEFPWPLVKSMAELGIVGDGIRGYGCPPMSPIATGLVHMELNRGDGSLGTFVGVQAGLAMQSIAVLGSEEQKQRWLPGMAALDQFGAFALTEPLHGSDSIGLETSARRDGDTWRIDGQKKWIGNGTLADVVVVWARDTGDGQVKGFLVEKGTPGYEARRIDGKASLRSVWQAEITLTDVRVPEQNRLSGARSFKDAGRVLAGTRNAVAWAALGHATAAYDIAVDYCSTRHQFGKPLVSFQIVQDKLVKMLAEVCSMQLYCLRLGRLIEEGQLTDTIAAIAKMNNTRKAATASSSTTT
jgi:glutaryl-CoA dehydrogenase